MRCRSLTVVATALLAVLTLPPLWAAAAQGAAKPRPLAPAVVIPQAQARRAGPGRGVEVTGVSVSVAIVEGTATTAMDIALRNSASARQACELMAAVPEGAVVRDFACEGTGRTAAVVGGEEASVLAQAVVAELRDPALLEFVDCPLVRSSVFSVPPRDRQRVRLVVENRLRSQGQRFDYVLPRSQSVEYDVPWRITATIRSEEPAATVYSPSHQLGVRRSNGELVASVVPEAMREPGPFRLSVLKAQGGVAGSVFAYPDQQREGGYFLFLAGLPAETHAEGGQVAPREVTLVLDRSGSMNGKRLRQLRKAAREALRALGRDEAFNIITYNEKVEQFSSRPVEKNPKAEVAAVLFIESVRSRGGTNLYDALKAALRQRSTPGALPIVLLITDGLPTVGQTAEQAIRKLADTANPHGRRVFTFGVGVDVNTPLLERIAHSTRADATFVLPKEDLERKVAEVLARLDGPVLADPALTVREAGEDGTSPRVSDVIPARLRDLFAGDQLVVLGRYAGREPLTFVLRGTYLGTERAFEFSFDPAQASTAHAFVPRLWASRKIAVLVDAIRDLGADPGLDPRGRKLDPKLRGLVDEVVSLSTRFGILTEYTAFLAREGTDLTRRDRVVAQAQSNFTTRALHVRSGLDSVNQDINLMEQRYQFVLNNRNGFLDDQMNRVTISAVQQVNDRALYLRRGTWVDSHLVEQARYPDATRIVRFGTPEYLGLARQLAGEGLQSCLALRGDLLLLVGGEPTLVKGP